MLSTHKYITAVFLSYALPLYAAAPQTVGTCPLSQLLQHSQQQVSASVHAREQTEISSEIAGKLRQLNVSYTGQPVKAGDLLAAIDATDLKLQAEQLSAKLKGIQAQIKLARYQRRQAKKLHAKNGISEQVLRQREAELASLNADQQSLKVQQQQLAHNIGKTNIKAPFSGVIVVKHIGTGAWINAGQPLFKLLDPEQVEIHAFLDKSQQHSLKNAEHLQLKDGAQSYPVSLYSILPQLEAKRHLYQVILEASTPVPPVGLQALLQWQNPQKNLPANYVVSREQTLGLMWVNKDNIAQFHPLPAALAGRSVKVKDLSPDSLVMVYGQQQIEAGETVNAEPACPTSKHDK